VRVLFYLTAPAWTGSARACVAAGRGLAGRDYQVTIVCPAGAVATHAEAEGCDVVALEGDRGALIADVWHLRRVIIERFIETVVVIESRDHLVASLATRLAQRGAILRRTGAGAALDGGRTTRLATRIASTGFIFTSAEDAAAAPTVPRARETALVDVGVETARYDELRPAALHGLGVPDARSAGARMLVCVYDPDGKARAATVLRAVAQLAPRHPELHLLLFGPGSGHEDLRMHAAALGIGALVTHLDGRDDDLAVLRAADLGWVVAGHDDGAFGALDFMAMRTPVLVERGTVAARYVADGITGCVLPPGDTSSVAATIAELLSQGDRCAAMGQAGQARVAREYSASLMVDALQRAVEVARDRTQWRAR
jgi:hypothetical protein